MNIQSLDELENAIGGRPAIESKKKRVAFYLTQDDHQKLKQLSKTLDMPVSEIVRNGIKDILKAKKYKNT